MLRLKAKLACCCALTLAAAGFGAEQSASPSPTVLALRNGRVLVGRVLVVGNYYEVSLGEQGGVRVPFADVEMCCADLDEAYLRKRDTARPGDVEEHLLLAEWCLRNGLIPRAADQLLAAWTLAPRHPRLAALERRLMSAGIARRPVEPAAAPAAAKEQTPADLPAPHLPAGAITYFTQKVQPMLLNRCASNACHGQRSPQQFQLVRPARGQPMSHRMTLRNLLSTLAFVDTQRPEQSRLLLLPRTSHGNQQTPVFSERDAPQYNQLVAWTQMIGANGKLGDQPPAPLVRSEGVAAAVAQTETENHVAQASYVEVLPATNTAANAASPAPQRLPASAAPTDPLDPEVFNREYAKSRE